MLQTSPFPTKVFAQSIFLVLPVDDIIYWQLFKPYSDNIIMLLLWHWTLSWCSSPPLPLPRLHRSILHLFSMTESSCDLPFSYHRQNILVPVIYFPLTPFYSPCSTSSCSSQRRFHFPSQANHHSLEVCRNRGRHGKTETGKVELSPATHTSPHPALPACNIQVAVGKAFYTLHQTPSKAHT